MISDAYVIEINNVTDLFEFNMVKTPKQKTSSILKEGGVFCTDGEIIPV